MDFQYKEIILQLHNQDVHFEVGGDFVDGDIKPVELELIRDGKSNLDLTAMLEVPQIKAEVIEQLEIVFTNEKLERAQYAAE